MMGDDGKQGWGKGIWLITNFDHMISHNDNNYTRPQSHMHDKWTIGDGGVSQMYEIIWKEHIQL